MPDLPDDTHIAVEALCATGDAEAKLRHFPSALASYWAAWDLLPEPKLEWEAATWVLAAIGDANFLAGDYVAGRDNLTNALRCPGAIGNPFLHLRLGQCQFEIGASDRAADELTRAYMGAGADIFANENPKYLRFLHARTKAVGPPKKPWQFWK